MIRLRRKNTAWLAALGLLIAFALIAGGIAITPPVQIALLAVFALAMVGSTVEIGRDRETLIDALKRAPVRQRISPQAREANERARAYGGYTNSDLMMIDLGVIAQQSSYEGMAMRRTRNVSRDDHGVRPFVTLYVDPVEAERHAVIRFEIFNQYGDQQYVHEMKTYLRDGEMNILADHHLPLAGNSEVQGAGDWDLRVYVDGNLVGMHNMMLTPSMRERSRRLSQEYADDNNQRGSRNFDIVDEVAQEEIPPRLQDLLKNESQAAAPTRRPPRTRPSGNNNNSNQSNNSSGSPRRVRSTPRRR